MSVQNLRIVTWNCRNGPFDEKSALLDIFKPDIKIIQEIPGPGKKNDEHCIWFPSRLTDKKGVAIISSDELTMTCNPPSPDLPEVFVPVKISGKISFNLLAVWAQKEMNYIESFEPILNTYQDFLSASPSVITGDFNSNAQADKKHSKFNHSKVVKKLEKEFNLISAYHSNRQVIHGQEKENTFYQNYNEHKPFHIDYCFIPTIWTVENVRIGSFADWCQTKKSDHVPVVVDVRIVNQ